MPPVQLDIAIAVAGVLILTIVILRAPKEDLDRVPASGLFLVFFLYAFLGWGLAIENLAVSIWIAVFGAVAVIATLRSHQLGDWGAKAIALAGIAAIVAAVTRAPTAQTARSVSITLVLTMLWMWAIGGARYRLEVAGLRRSFILWTLILTSWAGLWLGWIADTFVVPHVGKWVIQNLPL